MKKLFALLLPLLCGLFATAQTALLPYASQDVAGMKSYPGSANVMYVAATNSWYVVCSPCTADEVSVFAGAAGKKWRRIMDTATGNAYARSVIKPFFVNPDHFYNLVATQANPLSTKWHWTGDSTGNLYALRGITLNINGTAYDLSQNRSWTIATGGSGSASNLTTPTLTASQTGQSSISLALSSVSNRTGYRLWQSSDGGTTYTALTTLAAGVAAYSVTGLNASTSYTFKAQAIDTNFIYLWSAMASASATTAANSSGFVAVVWDHVNSVATLTNSGTTINDPDGGAKLYSTTNAATSGTGYEDYILPAGADKVYCAIGWMPSTGWYSGEPPRSNPGVVDIFRSDENGYEIKIGDAGENLSGINFAVTSKIGIRRNRATGAITIHEVASGTTFGAALTSSYSIPNVPAGSVLFLLTGSTYGLGNGAQILTRTY